MLGCENAVKFYRTSAVEYLFGGAEGIMEYVPIVLVAVGGGISLCALLAGLAMVLRHGGWQAAMQHTPTGHWSGARSLVYSGAMGLSVFVSVFVV